MTALPDVGHQGIVCPQSSGSETHNSFKGAGMGRGGGDPVGCDCLGLVEAQGFVHARKPPERPLRLVGEVHFEVEGLQRTYCSAQAMTVTN
jgi:hypothetical protein